MTENGSNPMKHLVGNVSANQQHSTGNQPGWMRSFFRKKGDKNIPTRAELDAADPGDKDAYLETPDKRRSKAFGRNETTLLFSLRGRIV